MIYKKNLLSRIAFITAALLVLIGAGIYYYATYTIDYVSQNTGVLSVPPTPMYPGLQQYFECKPYAGYSALLILGGLIIFIGTIIFKLSG